MRLIIAIAAAAAVGTLASSPLRADAIGWIGSSSGTWDTANNWFDDTNSSNQIPTINDTVSFNDPTNGTNQNETITLAGGDAATSLTFNNTGTTTLTGTIILRAGLTIGSTAGAVTGPIINLDGSSQTFTNNSSANSSTGTISAPTSGPDTDSVILTLTGNGSGYVNLGAISNGANSVVSLVENGSTAFQLNADTFSGGATVNSGTLYLKSSNAFGTSASTVTFNGGQIAGTGSARTIPAAIKIVFGNNSSVTLGGAPAALTPAALTFAGPVDLGGGNASLTISNATTFSGAVSDGGLTKLGSNTLTFTGSSSYAGATTVTTGTLAAGGTNAWSPNSDFAVGSGTTLNLAGYSQVIGSLSGSGTVTVGNVTAGTLTTGGDNASTIFSGIITGNGTPNAGLNGLNKTGTGTFILTGGNAYTGATGIDGGTLLAENFGANGSTGFGTVTISSGGLLGGGTVQFNSGNSNVKGSVVVNAATAGSGTPGGTVSAGSSSVLSPGQTDATANLTTGGQTWNGSAGTDGTGGTYAWKLNLNDNSGSAADQYQPGFNADKTGTNWDQLSMPTLGISGNFNVQVIGINPTAPGGAAFDPSQNYQWVAANVPSGGITNSGSFVLPTPIGFSSYGSSLGTFTASIDSTDDPGFSDVVISYSAAPEPASWMLLCVGVGGLLLRRRRVDACSPQIFT